MRGIKLLLILGSITVLFLRGEAAGAVCGQRSAFPTIQALPGKPGKNGAPGALGPKGEVGVDGINGGDGAAGPQRPIGPVGPQGVVGTRGLPGANGSVGAQGPVGPIGPQGPVGPREIAGINGSVGAQGLAGLPGNIGRDGVKGRNGTDGLHGPPGMVSDAVGEQLKKDILKELRRELNLTCGGNNGFTCPGNTEMYPATSCKEIHQCCSTAPSGYYWVNTTTGLLLYCQMETDNCGNITDGWMSATFINMTNVSNTCPQGWTYTVASSTCMCTRSHSSWFGCSAGTFPTHGVPYTKVCGRARGYQYYATLSFYNYDSTAPNALDSSYVSGLSMTNGSPRNHIWTFVAGLSKNYNEPRYTCPCVSSPGPSVPSFVGENYFCESGKCVWHGRCVCDDPLRVCNSKHLL